MYTLNFVNDCTLTKCVIKNTFRFNLPLYYNCRKEFYVWVAGSMCKGLHLGELRYDITFCRYITTPHNVAPAGCYIVSKGLWVEVYPTIIFYIFERGCHRRVDATTDKLCWKKILPCFQILISYEPFRRIRFLQLVSTIFYKEHYLSSLSVMSM